MAKVNTPTEEKKYQFFIFKGKEVTPHEKQPLLEGNPTSNLVFKVKNNQMKDMVTVISTGNMAPYDYAVFPQDETDVAHQVVSVCGFLQEKKEHKYCEQFRFDYRVERGATILIAFDNTQFTLSRFQELFVNDNAYLNWDE
jgi:hypothetical protein